MMTRNDCRLPARVVATLALAGVLGACQAPAPGVEAAERDAAAGSAGSAEPDAVLAAMKAGGKGKHAFGDADWWGDEIFGIDNALVGDWPVVVIEGGKARIKGFKSIPDWYAKHGQLLIKHMERLGQMYHQRA